MRWQWWRSKDHFARQWPFYLIFAFFVVFLVTVIRDCVRPAHAAEWYVVRAVIDDSESDPSYWEWAVASGEPDSYEVIACRRDHSICHHVTNVIEPRYMPNTIQWLTVQRRLKEQKP